jgi:hypothetical protein
MADGLSATGHALSLKEIAEYHEDAISSLRLYFNDAYNLERFLGYTPTERFEELKLRIDETSLRSMLITLASIEASFKLDYLFRCQRKLKDELSRAFRDLYKVKQDRVALDEDIFEKWRSHVAESKALISELRAAFGLRDWLAHGRYWQPKLGRTFDFDFIYDLAVAVSEEFFEASP